MADATGYSIQAPLQRTLTTIFGQEKIVRIKPVGGGSINECFHVQTTERALFVKVNSAVKFPQLFMRELEGLNAINDTLSLKTPEVISVIEWDDQQALLMEWVHQDSPTKKFWERFGLQLAAMHLLPQERFGWSANNYMGSVLQQNDYDTGWVDFFRDKRMAPLVRVNREKKLLSIEEADSIERLYQRFNDIFPDEKPCLLHGDLWSGNFLCNADQRPVLIDPAVYYGIASVDLAMTTLFGGFAEEFYTAYNYHNPLPGNYKEQWAICNLYPLLIHLYLFGSSYKKQVMEIIKRFA